ncbi:hypothetical protein ACQKWADRAFT_304993, partial [Trichoderma austrokoningii]
MRCCGLNVLPQEVYLEAPLQGLMIGDDFIPGGTVNAVPTYTIQRDPRFWPDAHVFSL